MLGSARVRLAGLIAFNLAASAALLLAIEGLSRLVRPVDFPDPLITRVDDKWSDSRRYDPLLFWTMSPDIVRLNERKTNSLGLRGPEIPPKDPGEFRILSLGESTTYAGRLLYEETYSKRVEDLLGRVEGRSVRVINAGQPGHTLFQGLVYLRHRGLALEPDAVMIYFGYNDSLPVAFRAQRDAIAQTSGLTDRELYEQRRSLRYRLAYTLQRHSNLVRMISFTSGGKQGKVQMGRKPRVPENDRRRLLIELRELCRERGLRLIVLIPWYREYEGHVPLLRELAGADDVILIDLHAMLADAPKPRPSYFDDAMHPTSEGHRLMAEAIAGELRQALGTGRSPELGNR
jgi:lysophospholipase L1-like esterase